MHNTQGFPPAPEFCGSQVSLFGTSPIGMIVAAYDGG